MLDTFETFLLGTASVIDTVLLVVLLERVNRPQVAVWLIGLIFSAWLTHVASFVHSLLEASGGRLATGIDQVSMGAMATGLILMPLFMVHAASRLNHTGAIAWPKFDWRYGILYLPTVTLPWIFQLLHQSESREFLEAVRIVITPYMIGFFIANTVSVLLFVRVRKRIEAPGAEEFFTQTAMAITVMSFFVLFFVVWGRGARWEPALQLLVQLSPLLTISVFVWFAFRRRLVRLVTERTLVYGAMLSLVLLIHQLFVRPWNQQFEESSQFDIVWVEAGLFAFLIFVWKPLRQRVKEGLRYLIGNNVFRVRNAMRRISLELARRPSSDRLAELRSWMEQTLRTELEVAFVHVWLMDDPSEEVNQLFGEVPTEVRQQSLEFLHRHLSANDCTSIDRTTEYDFCVVQSLDHLGVMTAFPLRFESIDGMVLLGSRDRGDCLSEEQVSSLGLLFDQFAATLHSRLQEKRRLQAERRVMQQEKLSVLGLMAGSLAHEIRNPLSSIRTITSVLREEMGAQSVHARDMEIIMEEIDRLTETTQRLLDFSKPANIEEPRVAPDRVIARLMHILVQFAKQYSVEVTTDLKCDGILIDATDASFSEILFNILRNGIEAAREVPSGKVVVRSRKHEEEVWIEIVDNGKGIAPEVQDSLFQPFVTAKLDGTGLGLFVAAERVREIRGSIACASNPVTGPGDEQRLDPEHSLQGTKFTIRIPISQDVPGVAMRGER